MNTITDSIYVKDKIIICVGKKLIILKKEIELSSGKKLPLQFEAYVLSEEASSTTNPRTIFIYEDEKIAIQRNQIKEIKTILKKEEENEN